MTLPDIIGAIFTGTLALGILAVLWGGLAWLALTIALDLRRLWRERYISSRTERKRGL